MMSDGQEQFVDSVLDAVHLAAVLLAVLTVPLLLVAVALRVRAGGRAYFRLPGRSLALRGMAGALPVAGLVIGRVMGVPNVFGVVSGGAVVLVAALAWRDDRFWVGFGVGTAAFALLWSALVVAMSYSFEDVEGSAIWPGGRVLLTWGGLRATRADPQWWWAAASVAVLRFGLPLGLGFSLAWLAATDRSLTRLERLAVALGAQAVLAVTAVGAVAAGTMMGLGLWLGAPVWILLCGLAASGLTLVTVGPGALEAALVTGRAVFLRAHDLGRSTATLASTVSAVRPRPGEDEHDARRREDDGGWRATSWSDEGRQSFGQFTLGLIDGIRPTHWALGIGVLVLTIVAPLGVGFVRGAMQPIELQQATAQVGLDMRVASAFAGPDDTIWLHGIDGELALFHTGRRSVDRLSVDAVAVEPRGTTLLALTDEAEPRVVALDGQDMTTLTTLPPGTAGDLAVDTTAAYVAGADGALRRYDLSTGHLAAEAPGLAAEQVTAHEGALWVLHGPERESLGWHETSRRDPVTLAPAGTQPPDLFVRDLLFVPEGRAWVYSSLAAGEFAIGTSASSPRVLGMDDIVYDDGRLFPSTDRDRAWLSQGMGTVEHMDIDGTVYRAHLPLDAVNGIVETGNGFWAIGDRSTLLSFDDNAADQSYALHWLPTSRRE